MVERMDDTQNARDASTHPGRGTLRVQVTSGTFPVAQAVVQVYRRNGTTNYVIFEGLTNQSGILDDIILPALPISYSLSPATAADSGTDYMVSIRHPDYLAQPFREITAFDQVESILPVVLEPQKP